MRPLTRSVVLLALLVLLGAIAPAQAEERARRLAWVWVREDSFQAIGRAALRALTDEAVPGRIRVTRGGRLVPVVRRAGAGPTDPLVFLATRTATGHATTATYEIWLDPTSKAAAAVPVRDAQAEASTPRPRARVLAEDRLPGAVASARAGIYERPTPVWFLAVVPPAGLTHVVLGPRGARPGEDQVLEARVHTNRLGPVALTATWSGRDLGRAEVASAAGGGLLRWTVPADAVPDQLEDLHLRDVSPPAPPAPAQDVSADRGAIWVDSLALTGPIRPPAPGEGLRTYDVESNGRLALERSAEAPGPQALLVAPDGTALGPPHREADGALAWGAVPPGTRLYVTGNLYEAQPEAAGPPPDPLTSAAAARHVILAVPALVPGARVLAAHRTAQGIASVVVPVADVYDRYGHGEASPWAIRRFVEALLARKDAPLEYLVLAGDATYDRTDLVAEPTIPTPMARSMYNGATSADRLYALPLDGSPLGGPSVGRLPFRRAEVLAAYVERVIQYETKPPAHASRRMIRFITSEARFGAMLDRLIENLFRNVVTNEIPSAYDIGVTFASASSPFLWPPPEFNDRVIESLNEGALFYTYVGHGFARGFDNLYVGRDAHRILHVDDVDRVAVQGTPPVMFVVACTTAQFDGWKGKGIGEALLARPRGPVAYWGSTRICHPAFNALMGQAIARFMASEGEAGRPRLGHILDRARDHVIAPTEASLTDRALRAGVGMLASGADLDRLTVEGSQMYTLLGDPALLVAVPRPSIEVTTRVDEAAGEVVARIEAPLPEGTVLHVSLELPRNRNAADATPMRDPRNPASFPAIRAKHDAMNDWALLRQEVALQGGSATTRLALDGRAPKGLVVKAWATAAGDVHQGAAVLP